jgi:anaerobic magnesium-protoporphyrin IX monomethyl ester cyclase
MKVENVTLAKIESRKIYPPLSVLYLADSLEKNGYNVDIFQGLGTNCIDSLLKQSKDSDVVGFSVFTGSPLLPTIEASKAVKKAGKKVVWGGAHPTILPKICMKENYIDFVVSGEGEETFVDLLDNIENPREVRGIFYKDGRNVIENPPRPFIKNLDSLSPSWHLIDVKKNFYRRLDYKRDLPLATSRGCPNTCSFCYNTFVNKCTWRAQSPDKVVSDVNAMKDSYSIDKVTFYDDNFFVDRKRAIEIASRIKIPFSGDIRADYMNEDMAKSISKNCELLFIGGESGDNDTLNLLNKGETTADTMNAVRMCKKYDIDVRLSMMIGIPGETKSSISKTIGLIEEASSIHDGLTAILSVYSPYPGTKLYHDAIAHGFVPPSNNEGWARYNWKDEKTEKSLKETAKLVNIAYGGEKMYRETYGYPSLPSPLNKHAYSVLSHLERLRCKKESLGLPVEIRILDALRGAINV